jgi:hypothetical protein
MIYVAAIGALFDATILASRLLAVISPFFRAGWGYATDMPTASFALAAMLLKLLSVVLILIVGVRFLRNRPIRILILAASLSIVAGRIIDGGITLAQVFSYGGRVSWLLYYQVEWSIGNMAILLMLPLANLVWFTRPSVRRFHESRER